MLVWLVLPTHAVATESALTLSDTSRDIVINPRTGALESWRLPGIQAREGGNRDLALPVREQLLLQGRVAGRDLATWLEITHGWDVRAHHDDHIVLELAPPGAPFVLRKSWSLSETPWRIELDITLTSVDEALPSEDVELYLGLGPGIGETPIEGFGIATGMYSFTEVVFSDAGDVRRERLREEDQQWHWQAGEDGLLQWAGLHSRYFALLVAVPPDSVPELQALAENVTATSPAGFQTRLQLALEFGQIAPGSARTLQLAVFGGPKSHAALTAGEPELGNILFAALWNWMRWLTLGILFVLGAIYSVVPSWGLAIILLAVVVRLIVHPVARNAMRAQKAFAATQASMKPEMDEIRRKYKGGEQSERILQLHEKHGVSPLAGLKPLLIVLIQIPVFVALFHLLGQAYDLRNASFLWMDTLAEPDRLFSWGADLPFFGAHFNLLPVVMALTTMLSIKLAPAPEGQQKLGWRRYLGPVLITLGFFLLFYPFPSGMVLYWTMANILHVGHTLIANREAVSDHASRT